MKKGLLLTLVILAVALLSTSAYGVTLTISEIPDILIGDEEDNTTIDNNFFIFTDVFNFDDKVSFSDSSVTSIPLVVWSFIEYAGRSDWQSGTPASENWISINDIQQNPGSLWAPGAYELSAAAVSGSRADFRNIQVSPGTGLTGALPYGDPTAAELVPRFVDLVAAYSDTDEGTSDTEDIVVALVDGGFDGFSEVIVYEDDEFGDHSTPTWTWFDLAFAFPTEMPAPTSAYEETSSGNGDWALAMASNNTVADGLWESGATGFMAYGLWQMAGADFFDWTAGKVYNARWSLVTDTAAAIDQPNWRTRYQAGTPIVGSSLYHQTNEPGGVAKRSNPISTSPASPTVFEHLWYPPQYVMSGILADSGLDNALTKIGLAVEMLDSRPASVGTVWVAKVVVLEEAPPAAGTQIYSAPPFTETDYTEFLFALSGAHGITTSYGTQLSVTYASRADNSFRIGLIEKMSGLEDVEARTYRLTAQVSSGASDVLPVLRFRLQTSNIDQQTQQLITSAQDDGTINQLGVGIPGATAQEIITYHKVVNFEAGEDIQFAIDTFGGNDTADAYDGTYNITGLTLEKLN